MPDLANLIVAGLGISVCLALTIYELQSVMDRGRQRRSKYITLLFIFLVDDAP